jgi:hypothetical protein
MHFWPITAPCFPSIIKSRNFARWQCGWQPDSSWPLWLLHPSAARYRCLRTLNPEP